jgi:hypothetical protein
MFTSNSFAGVDSPDVPNEFPFVPEASICPHTWQYSICYGNERVSLSDGDVERYVTTKLLHSLFNIFPVFIRQWGIQACLHRTFLPQDRLHNV